MDPCCEKDNDITLFCVVYGCPKFRENQDPPKKELKKKKTHRPSPGWVRLRVKAVTRHFNYDNYGYHFNYDNICYHNSFGHKVITKMIV